MKAKKTIAGVLALSALVTAVVSVQASAADAAVTLSASHETVAAAGDAFSVDVSIADVPETKVNVLDFALTYDSSILTVTDIAIGDAANTDVSADTTAADAPVFAYVIKDGEINVSWTTALGSDAWIADDGVILTISGTVNDGVADGTVTPIDFAPVTRETFEGSGEMNSTMIVGMIDGTDYASYDLSTTAGSVTVGTSVDPTDPPETTTAPPVTDEPDVTTVPSETDEPDVTTVTSETDAPDVTTDAPVTTEPAGDETTTQPTISGSSTLCGDVNVDGDVNMADVICLNKVAVNIMDLTTIGRANADVNVDGQVDGNDAMVLLRFQVQLINTLPYTGE